MTKKITFKTFPVKYFISYGNTHIERHFMCSHKVDPEDLYEDKQDELYRRGMQLVRMLRILDAMTQQLRHDFAFFKNKADSSLTKVVNDLRIDDRSLEDEAFAECLYEWGRGIEKLLPHYIPGGLLTVKVELGLPSFITEDFSVGYLEYE